MGSVTWDRSTWLDFNFCISQLGKSKSASLRVAKKIKISAGMAGWGSAWGLGGATQGGLCSNVFWKLETEDLVCAGKKGQVGIFLKVGSQAPSGVCLSDSLSAENWASTEPLPTSFSWHTWHTGAVSSARSWGTFKENVCLAVQLMP